jgi:hypothetical protein
MNALTILPGLDFITSHGHSSKSLDLLVSSKFTKVIFWCFTYVTIYTVIDIGPILQPLDKMNYTISKNVDVVDGILCLKLKWKLKAPKQLIIQDKNSAQSFGPTGLEYLLNMTRSDGTHNINLIMTTPCRIERIQECYQRGNHIFSSLYIIVLNYCFQGIQMLLL